MLGYYGKELSVNKREQTLTLQCLNSFLFFFHFNRLKIPLTLRVAAGQSANTYT